MAKYKKTGPVHYELLYLLSNKYTEEETGPIIEKVKKIITGNNGQISFEESWGKRKLAYPVEGFSFGYYNLLEFDIPSEDLKKINKTMTLSSDILRYQIVRKKFKTEEEIRKEKERRKKQVAELVKEQEEEKKKEEEIEVDKKKESSKQKMDLTDLDKKLDKILDTDDLL